MADDRPISRYAQRFVERKLEQFTKEAGKGAGLYYELFSQNFTDSVDRLASMAKRADLRDHILSEAQKTGNYMGEEKHQGRWNYDVEAGDLRWQGGPPLDSTKQVDGYSSWMRKSGDERARYAVGLDTRTDEVYPGIQIEKSGIIGPVKWGPEMRLTQDVWEFGEKMLQTYLGSEPRPIDIRKSAEMSERLDSKVLTRAQRKHLKDSAKQRTSAARKYGASESVDRELPPPSRSR